MSQKSWFWASVSNLYEYIYIFYLYDFFRYIYLGYLDTFSFSNNISVLCKHERKFIWKYYKNQKLLENQIKQIYRYSGWKFIHFSVKGNFSTLYLYISFLIYSIFPYHLIQHYVIKFFSDLRQIGGFLWVLRFPSPIKLTTMT